MSGEPDELYTLRNLYWLGNYQSAINEANGLNKIPAALQTEKSEYVYRCYLGLGQHHIILSEIKESSSTPISLKAIKLLATYMVDPSTREHVVSQLQQWLSDFSMSSNNTLQIIAATLYMYEDNVKDAIKSIRNGVTMEQNALLVQLYLRMDRLDLAQKQVKQMKTTDEDHILSMLASAWTLLCTAGKSQEAGYIYDELIDKYGGSPTLINGLAISKMHQGSFEEAETLLLEALGKAPSDPDSLANIIATSQHLGRAPEVIMRYLSQLRSKAPGHPLVASLTTFEGAFDRVAATLQA